MKPRVLHTLPVFAATDEPGWLILTRKKSDPIAVNFKTIDDATWEPPVKSWFIPHDGISDALDAIDFADEKILFCADCKDGRPCDVWSKIPRLDYIVRRAEEFEPPNRARVKFSEDLFLWRNVMSSEAIAAAYEQIRTDSAAREQARAQRATYEANQRRRQFYNDSFKTFEDLFKAMFGGPAKPIGPSPQVKAAAQTLGVTWPCSRDDLNAAFRKAALAAHPDRGGSTETMAKINNARELLLRQMTGARTG